MEWAEVFRQSGRYVVPTSDFSRFGVTKRTLANAVATGDLRRVRPGHYCLPTLHPQAQLAARLGARLACVSAVRSYGVFAVDTDPHLHLERSSSRVQKPARATLHWWPLSEPGEELRVGLADALAQLVRCQRRSLAIASLDNALHLEAIDEAGLADVFAALPARYSGLGRLVDGRSESGQESVLRLIIRDLGLRFETQPELPGIGRVDFLVEGRLIVEADSKAFHSGWESQKRDRERDLAAARQGFASIRPLYEHTMFDPDRVKHALLGLLRRTDRAAYMQNR